LAVYLFQVSLIAAKAYFFCLDTKETKNQVSRNAPLPHWAITLQIRQNLGCCLFTPLSLAHALASVKSRYACHYAQATIVLPDFIRSCSTDGRSLTPTLSKSEGLKKES
jgi:hypothetical protein